MNPDDLQRAQQAALRLLAIREHSEAELRRKLLARGLDTRVLESVFQALRQGGLLSDERFAQAYVEQRVRRGYGPLRIQAELRERGLDEDLIERHLPRDADDWMERLAEVHHKKFGPRPARQRAELARRARFLEYRGFPGEQVRRFLMARVADPRDEPPESLP